MQLVVQGGNKGVIYSGDGKVITIINFPLPLPTLVRKEVVGNQELSGTA
jgi:hypothetical protein